MHKILKDLSADAKDKLKKKKMPKWMSPMLAKLTHDYFSDENWIYERKLDGERILVFCKNKKIRLMTRNKKEAGKTYPEIIKAFGSNNKTNFIADGEMVAFDGSTTSFSKLQNRMHLKDEKEIKNSKTKVYLYLFDLLYFDDRDLSNLPLMDRKKVLRNAFKFKDPLRHTAYRKEHGEEYLKEACRKRWEGLIAKDGSSTYKHSRSSDWLKFKCSNQQEFVIGGYTDPQGERIGFGALLIGFYKKDKLLYAGKVGTGYDDETLKRLSKRLRKLERKTSPYDEKVKEKNVHWVTPELVGEVGFTEWTSGHKLRHPRFLGLRRDKDAKDVTREKAK